MKSPDPAQVPEDLLLEIGLGKDSLRFVPIPTCIPPENFGFLAVMGCTDKNFSSKQRRDVHETRQHEQLSETYDTRKNGMSYGRGTRSSSNHQSQSGMPTRHFDRGSQTVTPQPQRLRTGQTLSYYGYQPIVGFGILHLLFQEYAA